MSYIVYSGRSDFNYHLRRRRHSLVLIAKSFSETDRDFRSKQNDIQRQLLI